MARLSSTPASTERMVRLGSVPDETSEGLRFLQDRIAFFGGVVFILSFGFYLVNSLQLWFSQPATIQECFIGSGRAAHLAACVILAVIWAVARQRRQLSGPLLACLDTLGVLDLGVAFAVMGVGLRTNEGMLVSLLALTNTVLARAIIIPSTPRRTAIISFAAMAPILPASAIIGAYFGRLPQIAEGNVFAYVMNNFLWIVVATVCATVASKIIYGLQEKVREARQLGQYTLEEKIGQGGMGEVYLAKHALLRRRTAVKLVSGTRIGENQLKRFEREVQLTARLNHPNTISVFDYGRTPDGVFYYAMEYLDGINLEQLVQVNGPLDPARVIHILRQACGALAEAHGIGLIHRDVKPANICLSHHGGVPDMVKVLDFGLVKDMGNTVEIGVSAENVLTGTPLYMSPESIKSASSVDSRSDLYALGAVGYFLLTGSPVFGTGTLVEICSHHLHTEPDPPSKRLGKPVPADLEAVLLACLSKDPDDRPRDAKALAERLEGCADAQGWTEANAADWWSEHADGVKRASRELDSKESTPAEQTRTLGVDLSGRVALHDLPAAPPGGE